MSVHHDVMWYLFLIISIVCWTLYKILKDFGWTSFSKQVGFFRSVYFTRFFIYIESIFSFIWLKILAVFASVLFEVVVAFKEFTFKMDVLKEYPIFALVGAEYFTALKEDLYIYSKEMTFSQVLYLTTEKYLDYFLFDAMAPAYYFYDEEFEGHNSFLTVQKFNHSTVFEFVWAVFPTTILF